MISGIEKGSRQKIAKAQEGKVTFESGLQLPVTDGRIRQGDCLTDYKSQGIKGALVRGIEDAGSSSAMANKEAFHVKGTRHVENLKIYVESKEIFQESVLRSNAKISALDLEPVRVSATRAATPPPPPKSVLLQKVSGWNRDIGKTVMRGTHQIRQVKQAIHRAVQRIRINLSIQIRDGSVRTPAQKTATLEKPRNQGYQLEL